MGGVLDSAGCWEDRSATAAVTNVLRGGSVRLYGFFTLGTNHFRRFR
jgi:hypothetical protein